MNRKSASDILRERYMSSQLKKTVLDKQHPTLDDLVGFDYIKKELHDKLYMPLFKPEAYAALGAAAPRTLLVRGISGVGKAYIVACFCQSYSVPLITGFVSSGKDIRDLFAKAKSTDRSVVFINSIDSILEEKALIYELNHAVRTLGCCCMVVLAHRNPIEEIHYESEIFVRIPNVHERKGLLDGLLAGMKTRDIDTLALAQHTPGFVPRGMVKLVAMAVAVALARGSGDSNCLEMADFTRSIGEWKSLEHPITFDDIGAMKRVKEELTMSILLPSKFPEKFNSFGICKPSGVLLFGPPGCGKTFVAKAISNMSHCNFLSIKGPELITKYVGDSEKHLRDLFQKAKNLSPCVLFFDEIDSLCGKRGKNEFGNRIVNQILTLLDGMEDRGEVYIIGATNRIRSLDPALMRPGRFDKVVEVPLPGPQEALEIFEKCISKVPHEPFDFSTLDMSNLSGADIAGIVKEAAMLCLKENFDAPELKVQEKYILQSLEKHWHMRGRNKKRGGSAGPEGY